MVMVVSTRNLPSEYRTREIYDWIPREELPDDYEPPEGYVPMECVQPRRIRERVESLDRKREKNRLRQRRWKERQRQKKLQNLD